MAAPNPPPPLPAVHAVPSHLVGNTAAPTLPELHQRARVILSFWAVVLFLSLPLCRELASWEGEAADGSDEGVGGESVAAVLRLLPGVLGSAEHTHSLQPSQRTIDLYYASTYNPASSASLASLSSYAANMLQEVFREEEQMVRYFLEKAASSSGEGNGSREGMQQQPGDVEMSRKIARMIRYSSRYHITFSLFTASAIPSSWDIIPAIETYLTPWIYSRG
ncbi:hypothetical protein EV426DRAFT_663543 [Tirmania nivea]|nr:hypothetical protein EV426DRAFT_663543 [Tirmania nivea]